MKKIKLKESDLRRIIKKVINEQGSAFDWESSLDTNWYDWESSTGVKTMGVSSSGKWKCGVGCMVTQGEDR